MAEKTESVMKFVKSAFSGSSQLTSEEFYKIFKKYDADGNGYIAACELDHFLGDLQNADESATNLEKLKQEILDKYDANYDGKIEMCELAQCLPLEENFLVQFRVESGISSVDFMKIFKKYDTDKSGYIEKAELSVFLLDLLEGQGKVISPSRIEDYATSYIELFDTNRDGKLELQELARLLSVEENFLNKFESIRKKLSRAEFDDIFQHYDKDGNGDIEGAELDALIMDIVNKQQMIEVTKQNVDSFKRNLLREVDVNKDGKLQKEELGLFLSHS